MQEKLSNKENSNRHTVGKYLRSCKGLKKTDVNAKIIEPEPILKNYIDFLHQKGLQAGKVAVAEFKTKNGLPYTGLVAKEKILANEIIIKLPKQCLLTTKKCHFSDIQLVFLENPWFFSKEYHHSWEDNTFWAFLLYENTKGEKSDWYYLIQNLSKDIDYLIHWNEQDLKLLEDEELVLSAKEAKEEYERDYNDLISILKKYPQYFSEESYSYDNAKWIYTHLISRCFGNYFEFVTMVPFAEFLNHECSDVYYDFQYLFDNPSKSEESEYPEPQELTEQELYEATTSEGSYNSDLEDQDFDFEYKVDTEVIVEQPSNPDINSTFKIEVKQQYKQIEFWIYNNLDMGDNISIFFACQVYEKAKQVEQDFLQGNIEYYKAKAELSHLQAQCTKFKIELQKYNKNDLKKKKIYHIQQRQTQRTSKIEKQFQEDKIKQNFKFDQEKQYFKSQPFWQGDKFDFFVMKCSRHDQFEKGSQVYFCYGRLSNRTLLMRYGITLEYNKYDHVFIKQEFIQELKDYKIINKKLDFWKNISKYKKFKIKQTEFCLDLLFHIRAVENLRNANIQEKEIITDDYFVPEDLQFEIKCLQQMKTILEQYLQTKFSKTIEENEAQLYNKDVFYHEYFATVYKVERQRILVKQIQLINIVIQLFELIIQKPETSFQFAIKQCITEYEQKEEVHRNRKMLSKYLKKFQKP